MIVRKSVGSWLAAAFFTAALSAWHEEAFSQVTPSPGGNSSCIAADSCLTALVSSGIYNFNGLELAAAKADDTAYANLSKICGPTGSGCGVEQQALLGQLRELEDNAAELLGLGESQFSLHLSAQSLGFALRWTADEEYSTQSSLTNRLASSQLDAVTNRLNSVRSISQTLRFARRDSAGSYSELADEDAGPALGGGAGADAPAPGVGRWSVFASGSYGTGNKAPTTFNDAFNFSESEILAGADIQLSRHSVFGLLASEMHQNADFNSSESITSGTVRGAGGGLTVYFEHDWDAAYLNASVGVQRMSIDTRRLVAYPSNDPQLLAVNTNFLSSTASTSWLGTVGTGYTFYLRAFSVEPYLNGQYLGTRIGSFVESGSGTNPELALRVGGQSVTSLQSVVGLRFQYALMPGFGVILPYAYGDYRHEFRDKAQTINSRYVDSQPVADQFQLPTDNIDPNYYEVGGGLVTVLPHRTQLYAQYMKVLQLQFYSYYAVSVGFRYQF